MSWTKFDAPSDPLFRRYGLLKITELNTFHNACTLFYVVNKLNERLCDLIPISFPLHSYQTRKKHFIKGKKNGNSNVLASVLFVNVHKYGTILRETCKCPHLYVFLKID